MRKFLIISSATLLMGGAAHAADLGQYRPGNPYQSVIAPGADVCQNHCAGDAQCRSWNYVKASPQSSGVCEFNSNDVPPVSSAISISGSNSAHNYRRGVIAGETNTIRVGTATLSKPSAQPQPQLRANSNRRIVREPVGQQRPVQTAASTQDSRAAVSMPQTFKYDLGDQPLNTPRREQTQSPHSLPNRDVPQNSGGQPYPPQAYAPQNPASQYRAAPPVPSQGPVTRSDRRRQQGPSEPISQRAQTPMAYRQAPPPAQTAIQNPMTEQDYRSGSPFPPQAGVAPQYAQQNAPIVRRSATDPVTYGERAPTASSPSLSYQAQPKALARGLSAEQAQQSLFGKLNDDVQVPNSGATVPTDPNAPIPTMSSRASGQVEQSNLAGAPY